MAASGPPTPPPGRRVTNPLSLTRVESAVARSAAGFGIAFFLQSLPALLGQQSSVNPVYFGASVGLIVAALLFAAATSIGGRGVRTASITFCAVYLVMLVTWPLAVNDPEHAPTDSPWLYYLLTIATAMAAIGFGIRTAIVYLLAVPAIYALIRLTPAGGHSTVLQAALDSVYAVILGGVITIIFTILRYAARAVDRAQDTALERYSHAVRQHATEAERVQVDAIVHDSVLTTLLSAARAYTPEAQELAATMAGNAIGYLRDAVATAPDADAMVRGGVVASRIAEAAAAMSQPISVRTIGVGHSSMPLVVAEAVYSAAVQGMVNSLQHAGGAVERWVTIRGRADNGIEVQIGDRGAGFDLASVPQERLGVRVSIIERLATAGGRAEIESTPGAGTKITLRWPDGSSSGAPEFAGFVAEAERKRGES
ncbi:sensor histidine kinase [Lysinimonas soli]|uniref:Sensor histidine kinase n=1 Tax=Lysinimonas soli TaxID=1074233 RepID=A0ABW0NSN1_9MICO